MAAIGGGGGDIEELVKQITDHPGVQGLIIVNTDGIPIRHTFQEHSRPLAVQYSALFQSLAMKARSVVVDLDNNNDLLFLRVRSKKHEVLVAPDTKYLLIVIQQLVWRFLPVFLTWRWAESGVEFLARGRRGGTGKEDKRHMKPHSDHDAIEATKRKLKVLRLRTKAMDVEGERKEDLLSQLQMRLEAKRREKEYVGHKIRETMADTVTTLDELRAVEELEMLDSMLVEKNTQLCLQQQRHEMLLQQIENLETVLDGVSDVEGNAEEDSETSLEQWMLCCEHMYRHASAVERYCFCQTSHMVNHPVSVFYQSVRKMFRTTRERDERLAIECENIDALLQRALTMNSTIQSIEADYKDNMEEMRRSNQDLMEVIQKVGNVKAVELLYDTLQWVSEARNNALLYLKDGGLFPVDSELSSSPLLHGTADEVAMPLCARRATARVHNTNDSCRGAGTVPLRSVQILRRPRLGGGGGGSTGVAAGLDSGAGSNNGGVGVAVVVGTPPRFAPAAERLIDLSPYRDGEPAMDARNVEVEELRRQLAVAERDAHRIQQQYENLEEEAERELFEYETKREALEGRLRKAQDLVKTLEKEKSEWQTLHQQMSLLIS